MPFMQHDIRKGCVVIQWEFGDSGVFPLDMKSDFPIGSNDSPYTPEWVRRGATVVGFEEFPGCFYARLSAPGYTDCTDWSGPFSTEEEARQYLNDTYGTDENEEEEA